MTEMKISLIFTINLFFIDSNGYLLPSNRVWRSSSSKSQNESQPLLDSDQLRQKAKQEALAQYWNSYHKNPKWQLILLGYDKPNEIAINAGNGKNGSHGHSGKKGLPGGNGIDAQTNNKPIEGLGAPLMSSPSPKRGKKKKVQRKPRFTQKPKNNEITNKPNHSKSKKKSKNQKNRTTKPKKRTKRPSNNL